MLLLHLVVPYEVAMQHVTYPHATDDKTYLRTASRLREDGFPPTFKIWLQTNQPWRDRAVVLITISPKWSSFTFIQQQSKQTTIHRTSQPVTDKRSYQTHSTHPNYLQNTKFKTTQKKSKTTWIYPKKTTPPYANVPPSNR